MHAADTGTAGHSQPGHSHSHTLASASMALCNDSTEDGGTVAHLQWCARGGLNTLQRRQRRSLPG